MPCLKIWQAEVKSFGETVLVIIARAEVTIKGGLEEFSEFSGRKRGLASPELNSGSKVANT